MANVQLPVLFTISDSTGATLFGENITADLIENHLPFTLDRSDAFHCAGFDDVASTAQSTLLDAFKNTFYVGDPSDAEKLFYVNMLNITNTEVTAKKLAGGAVADSASKVVDEFCNKLADAVLNLHATKGLVHVPAGTKIIPVGGKAQATNFSSSVAPTEAERLNVGSIMARVASVHLVGHPLAQAIFSDEDSISTSLNGVPDTHATTNTNGIFKTNLARLLSHSLGGSQAVEANRLKAGNAIGGLVIMDGDAKTAFDAAANVSANVSPLNPGANGISQLFHYNLQGVDVADGIANASLKSLFEQLLNVSGRTQEVNDARGIGYSVSSAVGGTYNYATQPTLNAAAGAISLANVSTKTITADMPIKANDTLGMFLRPKLKLKFETTVTGPTNISFVEMDGAGQITSTLANVNTTDISTTSGAASGVASVFPGYEAAAVGEDQTAADGFEAGKYGWMGSANAANAGGVARSLTQLTTNIVEPDIMDQHIWKVVLKL